MARSRRDPRDGERLPIDHTRLIDGFGDLTHRTHYEPHERPCGRCGTAFLFTAAAQKYVLEVRRQPVKTLARAAYCDDCRDRKAAENRRRGRKPPQ